MKPYATLLSVLATIFLAGAQEPAVTQLRRDEAGLFLQWQGGFPPYQVEVSGDLLSWQKQAEQRENVFRPTLGDSAKFFRVGGAAAAPWGKALGQLRVMEGEFGEALPKHRLKSIWEFFEPPAGAPKTTPAAYWQSLILRLQYLEGADIVTWAGKLADLPQANVTVAAKTLTTRWKLGSAATQRDFTLRMTFPYDLNVARTATLISDAEHDLQCTYATPQLAYTVEGKPSTTTKDECDLKQVDDSGGGFFSGERPIVVRGKQGESVTSKPVIGLFFVEGNPVFILKTPILVRWEGPTTITGLTAKPFALQSRFSQTYEPFHHNFVEVLWLEPALEPGIAPEILAELKAKDIRFIRPAQPTAFPEQAAFLEVIGFDGTVRKL